MSLQRKRGPLLVQDYQLLKKMAAFNRERVPERVVHAKGSGAYGTFTLTNDVTRYTRAGIFSQIDKQTGCLLRFSTQEEMKRWKSLSDP